MSLDLGTGDGRLPHTLGREAPHRLFIGIDANAAGLTRLSGRAAREGLGNVIYVRASVEDPPLELAGVADRVTVVLELDQLAAWPSTWARRLAHGQPRPVFQVDARAAS